MKARIRHYYRLIRAKWPIALTVALVVLGGAYVTLGQHTVQGHEGGLLIHAADLKKAQHIADTTPPSAPKLASVAAQSCDQNGSGKLLLVSISQQHLWACDGTGLVNQSAVTTGTTEIINGVDSNTPTGTWHIYSKQTNRYLTGHDANGSWNDYVQYWMPFDGAVGFHDASWQTFPFGSSDYHTDGSHACVHLPTDIAAWVYSWSPIGTTVTVEA